MTPFKCMQYSAAKQQSFRIQTLNVNFLTDTSCGRQAKVTVSQRHIQTKNKKMK